MPKPRYGAVALALLAALSPPSTAAELKVLAYSVAGMPVVRARIGGDDVATQEIWRAKGALMARLQTSAGPLDVYNARFALETRDDALRLARLFELAEAVDRHSAGRPFLLIVGPGLAPGGEERALLVDLLGLENAHKRMTDHVLVPAPGGRFVCAALAIGPQPGVEARVDLGFLKAKPRREAGKRSAALRAVERAVDRMIERTVARMSRRAWVPIYGFLLTLRHDRRLAELSSVRSRAATARILLEAEP